MIVVQLFTAFAPDIFAGYPLFQFEIAFCDLSNTKGGGGRHLYFCKKTILVFMAKF